LVKKKFFFMLFFLKYKKLASNDPQRLTNRSVRGDPGRLLREEKMRSAMKNQVPKVFKKKKKKSTYLNEKNK